MYDYHVVFGVVASLLGIACYVPYFRDIFRGTTKPHPFSWFVWGLINVIAFFAQTAKGGGPGTWLALVSAVGCLSIAAIAFARGERHIVVLDWWCFAGSLASLVLWWLTNDPLTAIILAMLTDGLAGVPTFRKAYADPHSETAAAYIIGSVSAVFGLVALESFNPTTALYPIFIIAFDLALFGMLLVRRRQLRIKDGPR